MLNRLTWTQSLVVYSSLCETIPDISPLRKKKRRGIVLVDPELPGPVPHLGACEYPWACSPQPADPPLWWMAVALKCFRQLDRRGQTSNAPVYLREKFMDISEVLHIPSRAGWILKVVLQSGHLKNGILYMGNRSMTRNNIYWKNILSFTNFWHCCKANCSAVD